MPDIVRLRYVGALPTSVPALGQEVEPDLIYEFPGKVLTHHPKNRPDDKDEQLRPVPEDADFVLIESGNPPQVRAWQKSLWRNETPVASKKSKE